MKTIIAFVAVAALLTASVALAQDKEAKQEGHHKPHCGMMAGKGHGGMFMGRGMLMMLEKLDLTAQQKPQVAQILKDSMEKANPLREQMKTAFKGLRDVMDKTPGDEAAVRQAAQAIAKAGEDMAVLHGQTKAKIDAILTPEQKAKRDEMKAKFMDKIKERMTEHKGEHGNRMNEWIEKNLK